MWVWSGGSSSGASSRGFAAPHVELVIRSAAVDLQLLYAHTVQAENAFSPFNIRGNCFVSVFRWFGAASGVAFSGEILPVINAHSVEMQILKDPCCSDSALIGDSRKEKDTPLCLSWQFLPQLSNQKHWARFHPEPLLKDVSSASPAGCCSPPAHKANMNTALIPTHTHTTVSLKKHLCFKTGISLCGTFIKTFCLLISAQTGIKSVTLIRSDVSTKLHNGFSPRVSIFHLSLSHTDWTEKAGEVLNRRILSRFNLLIKHSVWKSLLQGFTQFYIKEKFTN